jgi:type VI protein secretion system component VasF
MNDVSSAQRRVESTRARLSEALHAGASQPAPDPLRTVVQAAADGANAALRPLAQQHPLWLVGGAAVAGGLVAWSRPWRWPMATALVAGLVPQLAVKVAAQAPTASWLALLSSLASGPARASS